VGRRGDRQSPPSGQDSAARGREGNRGQSGDYAVPRERGPYSGPYYSRPSRPVYVYRDPWRYYDPWGYGSFGLGYFYYSPYWGYPGGYGYGYPPYGRAYRYELTGGLRFKVTPKDAEVWVDGYYAGIVDDFDGMFQSLRLEEGGYRIEVRKPGYNTLVYDVRVQIDRTITFHGELTRQP
ncbi:MAG: PEGA domain-containing protein, partial [Acidobacteriota bacterium]